MISDKYLETVHLYLGLTKKEVTRRMSLGQIDPEVLKMQLDLQSRELLLEVPCEKYIAGQSLEQIDKFSSLE